MFSKRFVRSYKEAHKKLTQLIKSSFEVTNKLPQNSYGAYYKLKKVKLKFEFEFARNST